MGLFKLIRRIILLLLILAVGMLIFYWSQLSVPLDFSDTEERLFLIKKGQSLFQIASALENQDLIKCKFSFTFHVFLKGKQDNLQAGEYSLSPSMSIADISQKIISGDVAKETITIPEGWNLRDIAWYFENKGMFQAEELFELVGFPLIDYSKSTDLPRPKDFSSDYDFLIDKLNILNLEGYLFPDTYEINRGDSLEEIVRKMLDNFGEKLTQELRDEISNQGKTIFEIITMASLLEKEVRTLEDKKIVAGVLWKRLKNNIPLQVDATVIYITGKKTTQVSIGETKIDSHYNTYKYRGLPLGPISNPGLESILASIYPETSGYWYYLSTLEGETIFSRNLEEHNIAKAKYLK